MIRRPRSVAIPICLTVLTLVGLTLPVLPTHSTATTPAISPLTANAVAMTRFAATPRKRAI